MSLHSDFIEHINNYEKPEFKNIKQIILWGIGGFDHTINDFAINYINLVKQTDIKIICLVDKFLHNSSFEGIPILSEEEFLSKYDEYSSIPIIPIGRKKLDNSSAFKNIVKNIVNILNLDNPKILHPVFLADYLQLNYSNNIFQIGFGSAGNVLQITLLQNLLNLKEKKPLSNDEQLFSTLSKEHIKEVENILEGGFFYNDFNSPNIGTRWFNRLSVALNTNENFLDIFGIKAMPYLHQNITATHDFLFKETLEYFTNKNFKIVTPSRNPLEIIISTAFKIPQSATLIGLITDQEGVSNIRESIAIERLNNDEWFTSMALYTKLYFEELIENKHLSHIMDYETLLKEPTLNISNLSKYLEIDVSSKQIDDIWGKIAHKSLMPKRKIHYCDPKKEKYKYYLTKKHCKILKNLNYGSLLQSLGYEDNLNEILSLDNSCKVTNEPNNKILALAEAFNPKQLNTLYTDTNIKSVKIDHLDIVSNQLTYLEQFKKLYKNKYASTVLNSL